MPISNEEQMVTFYKINKKGFELDMLSITKFKEWISELKKNNVKMILAYGNCPKILSDFLSNENIMLIKINVRVSINELFQRKKINRNYMIIL